jgi:hypothetical protein
MFSNIDAELARKKLSYKDLSKLTDIKYDTLVNKLSGKTEFKLSEMKLVQSKCFPEFPLEVIFQEQSQ